MKHNSSRISRDTIIKNFKIIDNEIIVSYFDGSKKNIEYSKENYQSILDEMLKQAIYRDKINFGSSSDCKDVSIQCKFRFVYLTAFASLIYLPYSYDSFKEGRIKTGVIILSLGTAATVKNLKTCFDEVLEVNEINKYHIYLAIRNTLEEYLKNDSLSEKERAKLEKLNISTVDDFSLGEMKKLKENITSFERKRKM